jgi:hypothetical protein
VLCAEKKRDRALRVCRLHPISHPIVFQQSPETKIWRLLYDGYDYSDAVYDYSDAVLAGLGLLLSGIGQTGLVFAQYPPVCTPARFAVYPWNATVTQG